MLVAIVASAVLVIPHHHGPFYGERGYQPCDSMFTRNVREVQGGELCRADIWRVGF
jgi:hypothetical protein